MKIVERILNIMATGGYSEIRAEPKSSLTTDPTDSRLGRGIDVEPVEQNEAYLVLSALERAQGFVRPLRRSYVHEACGSVTHMSIDIAETYARDPQFYGATYCVLCRKHLPVGPDGEFVWDDASGDKVGT